MPRALTTNFHVNVAIHAEQKVYFRVRLHLEDVY
jgi:hypothetical protein